MNIIEQLGGYEKAKAKRDDINHTLENCEFLGGGDAREGLYERLESVEQALLKYRRQHNIFEVGDKVVSKHENLNLFGDVVLEIEYFRKLSSVVWVRFTNENDYRVDALRHATPEEIKAGKRL